MSSNAEALRIDRHWIGAPASGFNPTLALAAIAVPGFAIGVAAIGAGALPAVPGVLWQTFCLYLSFTVLHESMHGTAHRSRKVCRNLGRVCGLMLASPLPLFWGVHHAHHSHTNDGERDPDLFAATGPAWMRSLTGLLGLYFYRRHFYGQPLWRDAADRREAIGSDLLLAALLVGTLATVPTLVLTAWLAPVTLVALLLKYTFDYLPHHPNTRMRGRFHDTRIVPGRIGNILLLGQNYHLVHHLWPTVPWFRNRRLFEEIEPELRERHCAIGWNSLPEPGGSPD